MAYKSYVNDVKRVLNANKKEFCEKVGVLCVAESQSLTPVLTGNLKKSIVSEVIPGNEGIYIGVTPDAPYGIIIEKGSSKQPAQSFLEPGCNNAIPKIKNVAEDLYRRLG